MQKLAHKLLSPKLKEIHQGYYPKDELKALANAGLFNALEKEKDLFSATLNIAKISEICGNTGFCVWCQYTLIWYLKNSSNEALKDKFIPLLSSGEEFGGTGLSNAAKALAGIEKNFIKGKKVEKGFLLNGTLPWVSNLGENHFFALLFELENGEKVFGFVDCKNAKLSEKVHFCALEGSATKSVSFKDYFLSDEFVIGAKGEAFFAKVLKGFLILQCGMGLGLCKGSLKLMRKNGKSDKEFLAKHEKNIAKQITKLEKNLKKICKELDKKDLKKVLKFRLKVAELCLESAKWAMLHQGTMGYLKDSLEAKQLLESYFMGLVTPSIKHLHKLLH